MTTKTTSPSIDFESFLAGLKGKSIALVYSYSNTIDKRETWYDRWRSKVIIYFGQGAEALGLDVRYVDVDTYLSNMASSSLFPNEFILNLHSGLNDISSWPIISSFASWRNIPAGFCPSDVHITCERKDVTRAFALQLNLKLPSQWHEDNHTNGCYVIQGRDLGKSVGLRKTNDPDALRDAAQDEHLVVEKFISGLDATVAVLSNCSGGYTVIGARCCRPKGPNKHDWMFTEERKNLPYDNEDFATEEIHVASDLENELIKLSQLLGGGSVYRYDFRVVPDLNENAPAVMTCENSWFLEVTPTPAISVDNDFGSMMISVAENHELLAKLIGNPEAIHTGPHAPQAILTSCILFKAALNSNKFYRKKT